VTLIVVSGAPGTGKSTIARALGADLRFGVLSLDPVKEALADRVAWLAAEVTPLELGATLIKADTGVPGASDRAVAAVRAALGAWARS
jgi:adenylate kinase family enzyme